ncbi:MAG TPA: hypothetical protein VFV99_14855 [Kofleriaceae bacterium]|nr:hypothetical protein [Kofleriaceae bacterium]
MKVYRLAFVAVATLVACSDTTTNPVTQLNLDRPVDVAFACYGGLRLTHGNAATGNEDLTASAQPVDACNIRSGPRPKAEPGQPTPPPPVPPGQEDIGTQKVGSAAWYAFLLQSGPGTVAVARFPTQPSSLFAGGDVAVLDSDQLTPGKNGISVGEDPVAIATDKVGCYEVVANAGSCDLSSLDVGSAVQAASGDNVTPVVVRMDVKNSAGEVIRARPAAMAFEPPGGTIGDECPAQPTGLAYIAYPGCRLIAGVDVATGTIVTGVQFDAAGVATVVNGNVTCPDECSGAATMPGFRPVALDLEKDVRTGRTLLAIGADNSNALTVFDLDPVTSLPLSMVPPILLENPSGKLGITSLAISPVIGMGGTSGSTSGVIDDTAPGGDHQFIYAVATDGSVRVADLSGAPRECDTNVDPRYLHNVRDADRLSCLGVGLATTPPRRAGVRGPGIELIGDAIPTSVDVTKVDRLDTATPPANPQQLIGYFGLITAANGQTFVFNVDNDDFADFVSGGTLSEQLATPIPLDIAHQLRDGVPQRDAIADEGDPNNSMAPRHFVCDNPGPDPDAAGGFSGGPRLTGSIQQSLPSGVLAAEKTGGLPSIRQVFCDSGGEDPDRPVSELYFSAPLDVREDEFPDLRALRADETWTLTWEGALSGDKSDTAIDGPVVRQSQMFVDGAGMRLVDTTRPFCDAGVEPYDVVQFRGCDPAVGDNGCPIGYTCYVHPQSQVTGLGSCMLEDEAERLSNACKAFLTSLRRYTVGRTKSGELQLLPRKSVLRTTPIDGCTSDQQCEDLADYALRNTSSANPSDPDQPTDPKTYRCQADPDRRPMPATSTGKRCLLTCNDDTQCALGTVCQAHPGAAPQMGYCMEGVTPPQACVNAPQRFELRAGEAFTVLGTRQGYMHPIIANPGDDVCVRDPNANRMQIGRFPLDPPACDPTADPRTGALPGGGFEPNPCTLTTKETEFQLNYLDDTCTLADPDETIVTRDATAIRFRNRALNLTVVDPTYQGDLRCNGDRKGTLVNVPLVAPGYQIAFRQVAGFVGLTIAGIAPALPIKVLRGPTQSFWIIDEGDFLSTSITQPSTRGKVFRVEASRLNAINLLE